MSKLKKCLYLINLMERKGAMTLKEINDCYEYSSLYEGEEILHFMKVTSYSLVHFLDIGNTSKIPSLVTSISISAQGNMNFVAISLYMVRMIRYMTICFLPII